MKPILTLAASIGLLVASATPAQTSSAVPPVQTPQPIPIDVYEGPHPKHLEVPSCDEHLGIGFRQSEACHALLAGYEGWTQLNFMVDHDGKPYEITMTHSSGRKEFDALSVKVLEAATFVPASLNGAPIESGTSMKVKFQLRGGAPGAKREFVADYMATARAIESGDRATADADMKKLEQGTTNLYDASSPFSSKWRSCARTIPRIRSTAARGPTAAGTCICSSGTSRSRSMTGMSRR